MSTVNRWFVLSVSVVALQAQAADPWQQVKAPVLPSDEIQMVKFVADKGQLWIGTPTGAAMIEGGVVHPLKQSKDLKVWDVTKRPEGGLWVGHSAGALLVDGDRTVQALKGLNVGSIWLVGTQMWAIAKNESTDRNTVMQANGEDWAPVDVFKGFNVLDLKQDSKGTSWLLLDGDGVVEVIPGKPASEAKRHLARMNVTSILTDSQGRTWCGLMGGGVMVRQNNEWKSQLDKERSAVLTLLEDGNGAIWAATSGDGIWAYDGKAWKGMLPVSDNVSLMKMTSDKRIWISTQQRGGLRYWNGTEWKISLESSAAVLYLIELPKGVLVAGSARDGVYVLGDYSIKGE